MLTNNHNEIALEELIKLSGRYLSYQEFVEQIPSSLSDQINSNIYYTICEGNNRSKTIRKFKKQFDRADREFKSRRQRIINMLSFQFEEVE
jgi:hypothetical protein